MRTGRGQKGQPARFRWPNRFRAGLMVSPNDQSNPMEPTMTSEDEIARRKHSLLQLARGLSNVSRDSKMMG